jgi:hypothetical protein
MTMMQWIRRLVLIGLLASLPTVSMASFVDDADEGESNMDAYLGLSFKYNWIRPTDPWSRIMMAHELGFDVYMGGYINECWSVDAGYDWTTHKPLTTTFTAGDGLLGVTNTGALSFVTGKLRFKVFHVDLNYFFPPTKKPISLILSVGLAVNKPSIDLNWGPGSLTAANVNFNVQGKTTAYPRLGLGVQGMFSDNIGFRAMLRWENSCRVRAHFGAADLPDFKKIFHNGHSLSVGLLFKV